MERVDNKEFLPYLDREKLSEEDFLEVCFREGLTLERNGDTWAMYAPVVMGGAEAISGYVVALIADGALEDSEENYDCDTAGMPADCAMRAEELADGDE